VKTDADQYWNRIVSANSALASRSTVIRLESKVFESQLRKAFAAGEKVGFRKGHRIGKLSKMTDAEKNAVDDLFNQLGD